MAMLVMKDGVILNLGEWDCQKVTEITGYANPWPGLPMPEPEDWDSQPIYEEIITNPFPEGAEYVDLEIAYTEKGRLVLATDYMALRADAYPSEQEQMLAYFKGGEAKAAMEAKIAEIDTKYPAP